MSQWCRRGRRTDRLSVACAGPKFADPVPTSSSELIPALDESIAKAKKVLGGMTDEEILATWRMMNGEHEVFALPRVALLRSIMLNHWYHHRGQLSVYLRELDVAIPPYTGRAPTRTRSREAINLRRDSDDNRD